MRCYGGKSELVLFFHITLLFLVWLCVCIYTVQYVYLCVYVWEEASDSNVMVTLLCLEEMLWQRVGKMHLWVTTCWKIGWKTKFNISTCWFCENRGFNLEIISHDTIKWTGLIILLWKAHKIISSPVCMTGFIDA